MNASLDRRAPAVSLAAQDTGPALNLHTGYLDDRRTALQPGDARYLVFADAYRHQDRWDDARHRQFWLTHLRLWPSSGRSRPNREALAFVLALGQSQGFDYREVIDEMPGRAGAALRARGIPAIATRMLKEMTNP